MTQASRPALVAMDARNRRLSVAGRELPLPASRTGRIAVGSGLVLGGMLGFLPVLGFWMLPLGFLILSHDLGFVRRQRRRLTVRWEKWRRPRRETGHETN